MLQRARELLRFTREGLSVLGEMMTGLITSEEAGAQIDRLRRQYGLKDKP